MPNAAAFTMLLTRLEARARDLGRLDDVVPVPQHLPLWSSRVATRSQRLRRLAAPVERALLAELLDRVEAGGRAVGRLEAELTLLASPAVRADDDMYTPPRRVPAVRPVAVCALDDVRLDERSAAHEAASELFHAPAEQQGASMCRVLQSSTAVAAQVAQAAAIDTGDTVHRHRMRSRLIAVTVLVLFVLGGALAGLVLAGIDLDGLWDDARAVVSLDRGTGWSAAAGTARLPAIDEPSILLLKQGSREQGARITPLVPARLSVGDVGGLGFEAAHVSDQHVAAWTGF